MSLFSDNFGIVKTNKELALLMQQFSHYDPAYICQGAVLARQKFKIWMESLWEQYKPYADTHFLEDFKRQFSQRSWELYLGTTLLNRGFKLGNHKAAGPDFDVRNQEGTRLTWIEAISVTKGNGNDQVPKIVYGTLSTVPEEKMLLRVSGALDKKFKKFQSDLKNKVIKDSEPYIIALNRSDLEHVDPGLPLVLKAVFGIGHQALRVTVGEKRVKNPESFWTELPKLDKANGKPISMKFFDNLKHSGISAILYCKDNILNSPQVFAEMGENFTIVHNPLAKNPLPDNLFSFGEEFKAQGENVQRIRERKKYTNPDLF